MREVRTVEEIDFRRPCIYGRPRLEDCWIAYVDQPILGPQPSFIVLVPKATGEVLDCGSAQDEG